MSIVIPLLYFQEVQILNSAYSLSTDQDSKELLVQNSKELPVQFNVPCQPLTFFSRGSKLNSAYSLSTDGVLPNPQNSQKPKRKPWQSTLLLKLRNDQLLVGAKLSKKVYRT